MVVQLQAGWPRNRCSVPSRERHETVSSPECSDWLWYVNSPLFRGYSGLYLYVYCGRSVKLYAPFSGQCPDDLLDLDQELANFIVSWNLTRCSLVEKYPHFLSRLLLPFTNKDFKFLDKEEWVQQMLYIFQHWYLTARLHGVRSQKTVILYSRSN